MKYQAYPEYKASGIEWLGEVPAHWQVKRISYIAILRSGDSITSDKIKAEGEFPVYGGNGHRGYTDNFNHDGEYILIGRQGALCGNINYGFGKFWASEHAIVVHLTTDVNFKWLGELLRAMNLNQYNVSAAQPGLAVGNLTCLKLPFPNVDEQKKIAEFLDHETAKIDTLIEKQQQLITLLKEKRQAVISHAVTKGLNPDAPMRDSGVEWLGEVPEHWRIYSSKYLFPESKKRAELSDKQLSATQDYGVISQEKFMQLAGRRVVQLNRNQELRKRVDVGDFVISMRSFQGGLERAWDDGGIRSSYVVLKPALNVKRGYYQYLFKSVRYIQALQSTANFIRDGQDMNYQNFVLIDLPFPPRDEQRLIASFIKKEISRFDQLVEKATRGIELLQERRGALISAAVTGKIDVRNWQPPKPATNETEEAAA